MGAPLTGRMVPTHPGRRGRDAWTRLGPTVTFGDFAHLFGGMDTEQ